MGSRPAFPPSRPYFRVCVSVGCFCRQQPPCKGFDTGPRQVGAGSLFLWVFAVSWSFPWGSRPAELSHSFKVSDRRLQKRSESLRAGLWVPCRVFWDGFGPALGPNSIRNPRFRPDPQKFSRSRQLSRAEGRGKGLKVGPAIVELQSHVCQAWPGMPWSRHRLRPSFLQGPRAGFLNPGGGERQIPPLGR